MSGTVAPAFVLARIPAILGGASRRRLAQTAGNRAHRPHPPSPRSMATSTAQFDVILGSGSYSRKMIMEELYPHFTIVKAGIDEMAIRSPDPHELVSLLASAKAAAIMLKLAAEGRVFPRDSPRSTVLVTSDQVVLHGSRVLEKPASASEARAFILSYSQSSAKTVGSVLVTNLNTGREAMAVDVAEVFFASIPEEVADTLVAEGQVFLTSGGLMVEHPLVSPLITRMEGGMDAVMGLSKATVQRLIEEVLSDAQ